MSAFVPSLVNRKRYNEDGVGGAHIYTPWWLDNKKLDFPRGYHIEYGGSMTMRHRSFKTIFYQPMPEYTIADISQNKDSGPNTYQNDS